MADPLNEPRKTQWHRLLAQVVEEPLTTVNIAVQTEVDVTSASPKADIILLRREGDNWTEEQKTWLADGLRDTSAKDLLIEFKFTESLTNRAYRQLLVYDHLYQEKQQLQRGDLTSFLLLAKTPETDILERHGFVPTDKAGVYASRIELFDAIRIILLNELAPVPHNAIWKCFASRKQEWQKAFDCIHQRCLPTTSAEHEHVIFGLRKIRMEGTMKNMEPIGLTPEYVLDLGRREWLAAMMRSMPREELLKMPEAADIRLEGEQKGRREGEQKGRREGEQKGKVKILVRLLTRRFGALPAAILEKIAAADSDTLERWSEQVLDARSFAEVFGLDVAGTH
ncbi:MAG: DUF4351 domain-containing protein [Magnetococcales bacterium]|nr:DUF4351 domain-containing protein [Magnetococcales bacterium]MBF0115558.1 DUF4351 domain-containing protein [Magnetococcales bacterium]